MPVAHADPPAPFPEPVLPPLAPGQVMRIAPTAGTGTPTRDYGIGATDLCEFMEFPSGILQVCGDSFAGQGVGFGGWYSPIALHVETDSVDDPTGVRYVGVTGTDKPLLADPAPPGSSQLPAGVVQINRENYMLVTTTKDLRASDLAIGESRSGAGQLADAAEVAAGRRTTKAAGSPRSAATTTRSRQPDSQTRLGLHRRQQLRPHRSGGALPRQARRRSPTGRAGRAGRRRRHHGGWNKPPTPLWPDRVGEMSIRQIDGKTVLSYFNASTGNMEVRVADDPTALGAAPVTTVVFAGEWPDPADDLPPPEDNRLAQPYGGYISPGSTLDELRVFISQWNTLPRATSAVPGNPVRGEPAQAVVSRAGHSRFAGVRLTEGGRMPQRRGRSGFLRENGLLLVCLGLFAVFFLGMVVSGAATYNQEHQEHGSLQQVSVVGYLTTGDFVEAMFENWESEFLQMGMYVVLTAYLYQKGSSESKPLHESAPQDEDPRSVTPDRWTPWPVRKGGWALRLYEHSLALAFFALFFASFALHAAGGVRAFNEEQLQHGEAAISVWRYLTTSQFWFESMQNWQSEFIAVAAIVGLSIFLRQRGSAESKPVAEPHRHTSS